MKKFTEKNAALTPPRYFAADAAHELRTPLTALKIEAQLALKTKNNTIQREALKKIIIGIDDCTRLIQQLLILSQVTTEDKTLAMEKISLYQLTKEIVIFFIPLAQKKKINLEMLSSPFESDIKANSVILRILIRNIIDNAIRYTPSHGCIQVAVFRKKNRVVFRCSDTGKGIPPKLYEQIFERFYRIANTNEHGTGLGLAIVKEIAALHQAKIVLSKPRSGCGLQFDVLFPVFFYYDIPDDTD